MVGREDRGGGEGEEDEVGWDGHGGEGIGEG